MACSFFCSLRFSDHQVIFLHNMFTTHATCRTFIKERLAAYGVIVVSETDDEIILSHRGYQTKLQLRNLIERVLTNNDKQQKLLLNSVIKTIIFGHGGPGGALPQK